MGVGRRIAELYEIRVNALLDRAENHREVLDYSYARQQELLLRIRRAAAEVAAARHRAAAQENELRRSAGRLRRQARQAVAAGREDLARQALALRTATLAQADDLGAELALLRADEVRLSAAARRLQAKAEAFRVHKEILKARCTADEAASSAGLALGGISEEMGDVGVAQAGALGDLLACGVPAEVTAGRSDAEIQAELDAVTARAAVEEELARIKSQLAAEAAEAGEAGEPARGRADTPARPSRPAPPAR